METNIKTNTLSDAGTTHQTNKQSLKPQIVNNNYYQSSIVDSNESNEIKYGGSNDGAIVSSPSSVFITNDDHGNDGHEHQDSSSVEQELPNYIYSSSSSSSLEVNDALSNSIHFNEHPFDHSDISYSEADSDLVNVNGYSSSTPNSYTQTEMRTEKPEKTKIPKPIFKLKPTQSSTEKYILVQTISHENEIHPTKKPSTNDSIHSIMMMLNDTNPGPAYDTIDDSSSPYYSASTPSYESTSSINYSKYGPTSYYITTKVPHRSTTHNVPSTSYVYSPNPTTRRPAPTTTRFPLVTKSSIKVKESSTKSPQRPTTMNVPSTSYLYSPNPVTQRPVNKKTTVNSTIIKKTTPKPSVTVKKPLSNVDNNIVVISGGGVTKNPSPTVHITPKPVTNLMTTSILNEFTKQKKRPAGSTDNTVSYSTTPTSFISSSVYVPAIQDFHNEGYFVVTHHPGRPEEHVVSSTAIYTNSIGTDGKPLVLAYDPLKRPSLAETLNNANVDKIIIPSMTTDDFSNFPPVRNPNLNMTNTNNVVMDEVDISTPTFVEDEMLDSKMELLVSKIVASLQGNFDNLVDIVYERKNVSTAEHDIGNLDKNGTILKDSISNSTNIAGNKKPTTLKPTKVTSKPTAKPTAKPTVKPTVKPNVKVTTTRLPAKATTLSSPGGRPGNAQTTKKTPAKATTTTKKPTNVNKKPTTKPTAAEQTTKKPPVRVTQTTKKPSKRVTTTTPVAVQLDEEDEVEEEGEEEEEETVVEETENDEQAIPIDSGKIRKFK